MSLVQNLNCKNKSALNFPKKMPGGTIEVTLVGAKGLENTDYLKDMDPYVIINCQTQEHKSTVASGKGCDPEWNETIVFSIRDGVSELSLKIMDSDGGNNDDIVGEATIPIEALFIEGNIPLTSYNIVKDEEYCGEIRVGLTYIPEEGGSEYNAEEESYGGWKESASY